MPLQRAIALGDAALVRSELESVLGSSKGSRRHPVLIDDLRSQDGETLLHTAVLHEQLQIVQTLLALGASPHVPLPPATVVSVATSPPVKVAAAPSSVAPRSDNFRCSRLLHAGEATAIHYGVYACILLPLGAGVLICIAFVRAVACAVGNLDILKLLLSRDKHSRANNNNNSAVNGSSRAWSPLEGYRMGSLLLWAVASGHAHVAEFLLHASLESDCSDEDGNNAFGIAALLLGHDLSTLRAVLRVLAVHSKDLDDESDAGIDINHRNALGLTAFDVAESPEVREALVRFGARTARVVPVVRVLRWDREAFRRDVRLSSQDPSRPRAAFLRQSGDKS